VSITKCRRTFTVVHVSTTKVYTVDHTQISQNIPSQRRLKTLQKKKTNLIDIQRNSLGYILNQQRHKDFLNLKYILSF